MKTKLFLVLACALLLLTACAAPAPIVRTEGGKTIAQLGPAKFVVPPGFRILNTMKDVDYGKLTNSAVFMGKADEDTYTVIVFSMQAAGAEYDFAAIDLKAKYPDAFFIDNSLGFISSAATYVANKPMARQIFVEKPLCKVLDGYHFYSLKNRFMIEIYQSFKGEDPYLLCCGNKPPPKKDKEEYIRTVQSRKENIKVFRDYALALIKGNYLKP